MEEYVLELFIKLKHKKKDILINFTRLGYNISKKKKMLVASQFYIIK